MELASFLHLMNAWFSPCLLVSCWFSPPSCFFSLPPSLSLSLYVCVRVFLSFMFVLVAVWCTHPPRMCWSVPLWFLYPLPRHMWYNPNNMRKCLDQRRKTPECPWKDASTRGPSLLPFLVVSVGSGGLLVKSCHLHVCRSSWAGWALSLLFGLMFVEPSWGFMPIQRLQRSLRNHCASPIQTSLAGVATQTHTHTHFLDGAARELPIQSSSAGAAAPFRPVASALPAGSEVSSRFFDKESLGTQTWVPDEAATPLGTQPDKRTNVRRLKQTKLHHKRNRGAWGLHIETEGWPQTESWTCKSQPVE